MKLIKIIPLGLMAFALSANAITQPAAASPAASAGSFFQVLLGLTVVLALMAAAAWSLKKFGVTKMAGNATVKIVGGVSVGNRERVMVIEVGDQWIVVGVAVGQVTALSTMPRQENNARAEGETIPVTKNFAAWLKQTIDKNNGN